MKFAPQPHDEFMRMQVVRSLEILDTPPDARFDSITTFAAQMLEVPIATVSIVDVDRIWFKSVFGLDIKELARDISFCGHAICEVKIGDPEDRIFEVSDLKSDNRFFDNPLVIEPPFVRSYISYVLHSESGKAIGTLCALGTEPKKYTKNKKQMLMLLGSMVENIIQERHHLDGIKQKFDQETKK